MNARHDEHTGPDVRRRPEVQWWSGPRPPYAPYRLSDVERDEAITALGDAYAEGRLDHDEFEVRLEVAARAVLAEDLDPLFADLPRSCRVPAPVAQTPPHRAPTRVRGHRQPPFGAVLLLLVVAVVTHAWLLIPLAFVIAGHRRRAWAPWPPRPHAVGCRPHER